MNNNFNTNEPLFDCHLKYAFIRSHLKALPLPYYRLHTKMSFFQEKSLNLCETDYPIS